MSATPWTAASQAPLSSTISCSSLKFMSIELVMPSNYLILCCLFSFLPSIFPSIMVFCNELALHIRWPNNGVSASASVLPTNIQSLISFRTDWFDLACQGTLKSLFQHHNLKVSILLCLVFFTVQLSHLYRTTGKTVALTIWTFVSKMMSLLFNTLSRFVIAFLPRSRCLKLFSSSSLSVIRVESSAYLRLLIFLPAVLIPACDSSSPAFHNVLCI